MCLFGVPGDANITMYLNKGDPYHVVDLDPYVSDLPCLVKLPRLPSGLVWCLLL
jgi:hypothetical protein